MKNSIRAPRCGARCHCGTHA